MTAPPLLCAAISSPLVETAYTASLSQVREYKADVAKLREGAREAAAADSGGAAARAELGLGNDWATSNAGQRDRMLKTTDRLEKTGERITQGRQQLLETEVRPARRQGMSG